MHLGDPWQRNVTGCSGQYKDRHRGIARAADPCRYGVTLRDSRMPACAFWLSSAAPTPTRGTGDWDGGGAAGDGAYVVPLKSKLTGTASLFTHKPARLSTYPEPAGM